MKKIKVAHLLHLLGPAGKEKGVLKIVSGMDKSRFEVDLIVLRGIMHRDLIDLESLNIIELEQVQGNSIKLVPRLIKILRKNRYDIIYTHSWNTLVEGYIAALSAGIPIKIHGEHGTFERSYLKDKLQKLLWKKFDSVTVVVGDLKNKLIEIFGYKTDNIRIVYNGTDHTKFYPSPELREEFRKKYGLEGYFLVGTVGRFYEIKDHFTLIRGFNHFRSLIPNAKLVLVGGGGREGDKNKERYNQLIKELGLIDDVVFIPPVANPEALMNTFDIFVLSSINEGCSNVILEAMACGIPLVVTDTGGNPELVTDRNNGLLFEVGNYKELAEKLHYLYVHPEEREKFSRRGIQLIKEKFSLKRTILIYEKLYSDLYHQKRNGKLF
jgi:glycosyltransferase involved in cell wall biosynthesis